MPARGRAFDHQAVYAAAGAAQHGGRQRVGRDDGQKLGPIEHRQRAFRVFGRIEPHRRVKIRRLPVRRAGYCQAVLRRMLRRKGVQHAGDVQRDSRAHQHIAHARQHGAVDRGQVRHLHLLKIIDAHRILVAFPGQKHFNEVADHAQLDELARIVLLVHGKRLDRAHLQLAAGNEILLPDASGHLWKGKCVQSPAHVAALVAVGKPAHKDRIERRARHDAQLAEF